MRKYSKQFYIKLFLILVSEGLAMFLTETVSKYVVPIQHTTLSYIVCGAVLAILVVNAYENSVERKRHKLERELRELTNAAFIRYSVGNKDNNRK